MFKCIIKQNNSKSSLNTTRFVLFTDWALTFREERRLRVSENTVLRGIFGVKRDEVTVNGENYIMKSLMIYTAHSILFGWKNREK